MQQGVYDPGFHRVKSHPLLRAAWQRRQVKLFLSRRGGGLHCGMFPDFQAAKAWLPPTPGFHVETFADEYVNVRSKRVYAFDYPVMLWLQKAFDEGAGSVFDIGGSVGNQYYAYRRYLRYPEGLTWHVDELPLSVARGMELAQRENASALMFTTGLDVSRQVSDVWIAAGVLEFLEGVDLPSLLAQAKSKPTHILLNKLPLHAGADFVSTQNIGGGALVPHHVYNRERFVKSIEAAGYQLHDSWDVVERSFHCPLHPGNDFEAYSGLYFRKA